MKLKLNLDPAEVPDFEQIAKTLEKAVESDEISSENLSYITTALITLCCKCLTLSLKRRKHSIRPPASL